MYYNVSHFTEYIILNPIWKFPNYDTFSRSSISSRSRSCTKHVKLLLVVYLGEDTPEAGVWVMAIAMLLRSTFV